MHKIEITLPGNAYEGSIELDGKPLEGVTRISMVIDPSQTTAVVLTIVGHITVDGELDDTEIVHVERNGFPSKP